MGAPIIDPSKPWKPRASSIGLYAKCLWRAAQDRLIHEGRLPVEAKATQLDTSFADLGSVIHFCLQDGTRCVFPGDPKDFAPTQQQWESASLVFGRDMTLTQQRVRASATLAAQNLPRAPDGLPWRAEDELENQLASGHTDFLSQCGTVIGDLKTTSKPPPNRRIKYEHYFQLCTYRLLCPQAKKAFVLYVDSQRAQWTTLVWIDFEDPKVQFFVERVADFCRFLMSDRLLDAAYPNLGDHCSNTWCGYKGTCHDEYAPRAGNEFNAIVASRPTGVGAPMQLRPLAS